MSGMDEIDDVRSIVSDLDNLISEILQVRRRVAALANENRIKQALRSVRDAEWFGMWAKREDMQGLSSREWLTKLRTQQWAR